MCTGSQELSKSVLRLVVLLPVEDRENAGEKGAFKILHLIWRIALMSPFLSEGTAVQDSSSTWPEK